jgi:tetratricopeptide (TPR) repeat protein
MKKQSIKGLAFIAVTSSLVASCDLLKDLDYKVTPDPLEMHNDSVRVKIEVNFPEKGIKKKASAELTPVLGNTALKTATIQGEKAPGNGTVIQYKPGGKYVYTDVVAYKPEFEYTDLKITGKVYKGGKEKEGKFEDQVIGKGTIITPYLVNKDFRVIYAKDEFKRVNEQTYMAQINYEKAKSVVRPAELKDKDIVDLGKWLAAAQTNPKIALKNVNITGYASPEGEVGKNNELSDERAAAAKKVSMDISKKNKNDKGQTEIYNLSGRGEDFDGFKAELQKSTTIKQEDKDLILRVLQMYSDPVQRETEMRNLGKSFTDLDKNVFPKLRRAEIAVVYDLTGYSDEEMVTISKSEPQKLNYEELLFTGGFTSDLNEKMRLYKEAEIRNPSDYRAANNLGAVYYQQGKMNEAKAQFEKANAIKDNPISKNNLAAIAGAMGDRAKAAQLLGQADGGGADMKIVNYNKGIIAIQNGKYAEAAAHFNFSSEPTFNKALAQLLDKNPDGAIKTIDASPDKESGQGYYLKAVANARQDKMDGTINNLKSAIAKEGKWKEKAAKDREFFKYEGNDAMSFVK